MVSRRDISMRFKQYAYMKDRHIKGRKEITLAGGQSSFPGNLTPAIKGQTFKHNPEDMLQLLSKIMQLSSKK